MRWRGVLLALTTLAGCHELFDLEAVNVSSPRDSGAPGTFRSTLRIDRINPATPLLDFPLLVVLDDTRAARSLFAPGAADLRFYDDDGRLIPHEIEQVGAPGGDPLLAWVRVPQIDGAQTTISVDYGRSATVPPSADPVWSSTYAGVWHLGDSVGDTSGGGHDGIPNGAVTFAGTIGRGQSFDGVGNWIEIPASRDFQASELTVSGWILQRTQQPNVRALLSRPIPMSSANDLYLGMSNGMPYAEALMGGMSRVVSYPTAITGEWVHLAIVARATGVRLFVNGSVVDSVYGTGNASLSQGPMYLGADCNTCSASPDDDFLDGVIDEVRFETIGRSPEWVEADVASMRDDAITYGPVDSSN